MLCLDFCEASFLLPQAQGTTLSLGSLLFYQRSLSLTFAALALLLSFSV